MNYDVHPGTDEIIEDFDREVERNCCELDFWFVLYKDKELGEILVTDIEKTGSFNKTYERFKEKYKL